MEDQVDDISRSMVAHMSTLEKNIIPFSKKPKSHEKLEYHESREEEELKLEKSDYSN